LIVTMVIGLTVFFGVDANIVRMSNNDMIGKFWNYPDSKDPNVLKVQVLAQQWAWNFRYAGPDGLFNTDDDVVTLNDLRVPANTKILFHITSKDVIHSFFIANARTKVDAIPGRITQMWVEFTKTGDYEIACAEMCGTHHYLMGAKLKIYSPEEFVTWRDESRTIAQAANDPQNLDLFWGWNWE